MAIEKVREYFKQFGREKDILEFETSSATVELAAIAVGTNPENIAKTLSFMIEENPILIVTSGNMKIDNSKYKSKFEKKAKMMSPDEVDKYIGHSIGGVCPFAIPNNVKVYIDNSIKEFDYIYPACGSSNSAIKLTPEELFKFSNALEWIDVCKKKDIV